MRRSFMFVWYLAQHNSLLILLLLYSIIWFGFFFFLSACLELCGCESPVPNSCMKNLLFSCFGVQWIVWKNWDASSTKTLSSVWGTAKNCGSTVSAVVAVVSFPFSWEGVCPWLFKLPCCGSGRLQEHRMLRAVAAASGTSPSLPCVCACSILLLSGAGPGGFSGVEGFLSPT